MTVSTRHHVYYYYYYCGGGAPTTTLKTMASGQSFCSTGRRKRTKLTTTCGQNFGDPVHGQED